MTIKRQCPSCGKHFNARRESSKYCSRPCMWKQNGGHNRKEIATWWRNQRGYVEGRVWVNGKQVRYKYHRWIVEQVLGRPLRPSEDVHHRNGLRDDNRLENLELVEHGAHSTLTNANRQYKRGYKLRLTDDGRKTRSERAKAQGLGTHNHRARWGR